MSYATPRSWESYSAFFWTDANHGSSAIGSTTKPRSACALCSARSTVAIRCSIRLPVNVISLFPVFFSGRGLILFYLAAPAKLHHRVVKSLPGTPYHHRTGKSGSPARALFAWRVAEPGSFSGANSNFFGGAHLRTARPGIAINLFFARRHRLFRQQPVPALLRTLAKRILDDSVFERVKADHHQPSTRLQHAGRHFQQCFQIVQFMVYEDSESLKGSGRRMNPLMFH